MFEKSFSEREFIEELNQKRQKEFLKRISQYDANIAPIMRSNGYVRLNQSERTVLFTFGEITFSRSRWSNGRQTRYPVDEWLGLKKYTRHSPELMYHITRYASVMSYRQVCRMIKLSYKLDITKDSVLKAIKFTGKLFKENEQYRFRKEEVVKKIKAHKIYIEGDGVMVKTSSPNKENKNTDLAHFLVHTGSKQVEKNRFELQNKHEIVHTKYDKAKEELLDYLYNHYEITDETVLITNSDNGKGYTKRTFNEIQKALGVKQHEHFWDSYHVKDLVRTFFRNHPKELKKELFKALENHDKSHLKTIFDTIDSLMCSQEENENFSVFKQKLLRHFKDTKPAKLRGLSSKGIGVMESQHRKITYRMKHRGMYWFINGAYTMSRLILMERINQLDELFFGEWRKDYEFFKGSRLSAGNVADHKPSDPKGSQRILLREGKSSYFDRQKYRY